MISILREHCFHTQIKAIRGFWEKFVGNVMITNKSFDELFLPSLVKVRLTGGETANEGRVEVYYQGVWGAVCNQYWDMNDANVVCRSLGLPAASYVFSNTYMFGGGRKRSWMTRLRCSGTESSLADCSHAGWGNTYSWCSYYYYHAAVVCGQPAGNILLYTLFSPSTFGKTPKIVLRTWKFVCFFCFVFLGGFVFVFKLRRMAA